MLQTFVHDFGHRAEHRAARADTGFEQLDDVLDLPVAEPCLDVGRERWRVPVEHGNHAAREVRLQVGPAERIAAGMARVAVAESLHEICACLLYTSDAAD